MSDKATSPKGSFLEEQTNKMNFPYDHERIHREQINLPPLNANTTLHVRYVHVQVDGTEVDYASPPADLRTIKVTLGKARKSDRTIVEETIIAGPWSPPGRGWELANGRNNQSRWQRRRKQVWQQTKEGS